jgi:hypothetical protein
MMALIKESVNDVLNSLVGEMFAMNRMLDRQMSLLNIRFVMQNTSETLHVGLAHAYPLLGDLVSDYQGSRGNETIYPETPIGDANYSSPNDIFSKMLEAQLTIEDNICEAIVFAQSEGDYSTYSFLQEFLEEHNKYTEQIMLLNDKINMYGEGKLAWMLFDRDVKKFMIL